MQNVIRPKSRKYSIDTQPIGQRGTHPTEMYPDDILPKDGRGHHI